MTHSLPRPLSLFVLASLLCLAVPAWGQQLEIDKDATGIRIIQKHPPRDDPPKAETPPAQGETPPDAGPTPEAPGTPEDKSSIPLEETPEYIAALNELTAEYNRRSQDLQQRADDLGADYAERMGVLMERVREVERELLRIQNVEGTKRRFQALQEVLDDRQRDVEMADRLYTSQRDDLQSDKEDLDAWYEKEQRKLRERMR